jgi:hypothetical protein
MKKIILCLLSLVLITSCQAKLLPRSIQLSSQKVNVLDKLVCEPPCWQNITPGVTTKAELKEILSSLEFVNQDTISFSDNVWNGFEGNAGCKFTNNYTGLDILFLGDKVVWMDITGIQVITLENAIQILGEPSYIAMNYRGSEYTPLLFNPSKGISIVYLTFAGLCPFVH